MASSLAVKCHFYIPTQTSFDTWYVACYHYIVTTGEKLPSVQEELLICLCDREVNFLPKNSLVQDHLKHLLTQVMFVLSHHQVSDSKIYTEVGTVSFFSLF